MHQPNLAHIHSQQQWMHQASNRFPPNKNPNDQCRSRRSLVDPSCASASCAMVKT